MIRVSFYIDGFNVYHSIERHHSDCKWLDLHKMVRSVVPVSSQINHVHYFSALAHHRPDKVKRHEIYIDALKATGVNIVLGKFKPKERYCRLCHRIFTGHEEKRTDVNIAIKIVEDAFDNCFDSAILVSGDTDFVPIVTFLKKRFPENELACFFLWVRGQRNCWLS